MASRWEERASDVNEVDDQNVQVMGNWESVMQTASGFCSPLDCATRSKQLVIARGILVQSCRLVACLVCVGDVSGGFWWLIRIYTDISRHLGTNH